MSSCSRPDATAIFCRWIGFWVHVLRIDLPSTKAPSYRGRRASILVVESSGNTPFCSPSLVCSFVRSFTTMWESDRGSRFITTCTWLHTGESIFFLFFFSRCLFRSSMLVKNLVRFFGQNRRHNKCHSAGGVELLPSMTLEIRKKFLVFHGNNTIIYCVQFDDLRQSGFRGNHESQDCPG